jgi:hypothetical protein
MTENDDWRLTVGETLDDRRARLILARFGPEARRIGRGLATRLRAETPGRVVEGTTYGLNTLLAAYPDPRRKELTAIALGHIWYEPSGGGIKVIPILLDWERGRV